MLLTVFAEEKANGLFKTTDLKTNKKKKEKKNKTKKKIKRLKTYKLD